MLEKKNAVVVNISATSPVKSTAWSLVKTLKDHDIEAVQINALGAEAIGVAMKVIDGASQILAQSGLTLWVRTGYITRPGRKATDSGELSVFVLRFMAA